MLVMKSLTGNGERVSRAIASSIPNRNVRIMMRALTSHASHSRSLNMECISDPDSRYRECSCRGTHLAERMERVHARRACLTGGGPRGGQHRVAYPRALFVNEH